MHKTCFQAKRDAEKEAELRNRRKEENERKEKMSKMTADELVEFKRKEQEERNKRDKEFKKQFDRYLAPSNLLLCTKLTNLP